MNGGFIQSWLNEVDLKVFDDDTCKKTKSKKGFISGSMFCAGYLNGKYTIKRLLTFKSATIIEIGIRDREKFFKIQKNFCTHYIIIFLINIIRI